MYNPYTFYMKKKHQLPTYPFYRDDAWVETSYFSCQIVEIYQTLFLSALSGLSIKLLIGTTLPQLIVLVGGGGKYLSQNDVLFFIRPWSLSSPSFGDDGESSECTGIPLNLVVLRVFACFLGLPFYGFQTEQHPAASCETTSNHGQYTYLQILIYHFSIFVN